MFRNHMTIFVTTLFLFLNMCYGDGLQFPMSLEKKLALLKEQPSPNESQLSIDEVSEFYSWVEKQVGTRSTTEVIDQLSQYCLYDEVSG